MWNGGMHQAYAVEGSGGVAILYSADYFDKILETGEDSDEGRWCYIICSKDGDTKMFLNIYAPTQKNISKRFFELTIKIKY